MSSPVRAASLSRSSRTYGSGHAHDDFESASPFSLRLSPIAKGSRRGDLQEFFLTPVQGRSELIEEYTMLADEYQELLDERDGLMNDKKALKLQAASIRKQDMRLKDLVKELSEQHTAPIGEENS
jgi:hypothetical protein